MSTLRLFFPILSLKACITGEGDSLSRLVPAGKEPHTNPIVVGIGTEDSEVVDVISTPRRAVILVASPAAAPCDGSSSSLCVIRLGDGAFDSKTFAGGLAALGDPHIVDLGPGQATSVAGHPLQDISYVVSRHPTQPSSAPGTLFVVAAGRIEGRIPLDPGPDSIAVSSDGRLAVVACGAESSDEEDCPNDTGPDALGSILLFDLGEEPARPRLRARVSATELHARYFGDDPARAASARDIQPEYAAVSPDATISLVTLQEQSAVAVLDLVAIATGPDSSPDATGSRILAGVVFLPHDQPDPKGGVLGTHPDGVAISRDGRVALTANEAHGRSRAAQSISVIDLSRGASEARLVATHSVFDLDPTLRDSQERPVKELKGKSGRADRPAARRSKKLPRLDPEGIAITVRGSRHVAALAIERRAPNEPAGSVLLLELDGALEGRAPRKLARTIVGSTSEARPETLDFTSDGRWLVVAAERDGGTLTVLDMDDLLGRAGNDGTADASGR